MKIVLPHDVKKIIHTLETAGYEAFAVGGCIRDAMLGRKPQDWDITTSAKPEEIKQLFPRTVDTGIAHGTVTVMLHGCGYEVTTYRIDGDYEDHRRPKEVSFTTNLREDLRRRDFTINAMAYNERLGLVDAFGGMEDLDQSIIRAVGTPEQRFAEDALRVMRGVRFAAQLGFEMERETRKAAEKAAPDLAKISRERIQVELVKLLCSPHPEEVRELYRMGITDLVFPEFSKMMVMQQNNPYHIYTVGEHSIHVMMNIRNDKVLRLAALFHDAGKPMTHVRTAEQEDYFNGHAEPSAQIAKRVMKDLKFDNDTIYKVCHLVRNHACHIKCDKVVIRQLVNHVGQDMFLPLLELMEADTLGKSSYQQAERLREIQVIRGMYQEILDAGDCLSLKQLAVTGQDLIKQGMKPGKQLGETLQLMLEDVLIHPEDNDKELLLQRFVKEEPWQ